MDEWDKIIRQKVSGLDTPPPGTGWQPARSWEKLQAQIKPAAPLRTRHRWPWYYAAAAAFVILGVPFAVMLSDIYRQQRQIDRLAAQLAQTKPAVTPPAPVAGEARPAASAVPPPPARAAAAKTPERRTPAPLAPRVPGAAGKARQPEALPPTEPEATRLAQQPVPAVAGSVVEAAHPQPPAPAEDAQARLLRLVSTAPKRTATSVTIVFEGTGPDPTGGSVLASTTEPAPEVPRRRFLRAFGGSKREETLSAKPEPPNNILSLLNKEK
jgi:HAMP domain-containing protein